MTTTTTVPRYSTRELQAAAAALAAGRFAAEVPGGEAHADRAEHQNTSEPTTSRRDAAISTRTAAVGVRPAATPVNRTPVNRATGIPDGRSAPVTAESALRLASLVRVRAANAGAGASTIALAIADAADAAGLRTRVLDAAAPAWSGLVGATATELGAAEGWRRGRRGNSVLIDRLEAPVEAPAEVPDPRSVDGVDLTVLDAGWSLRELTAASASEAWLARTSARAEVLVTRPNSLALSQTEAALADLEEQLAFGQVVVVVVGAPTRTDRDLASAGRRLQRARDQGAVLFTPSLPTKALSGLGPSPLPKQLTTSSQRLLERITTITGPLPANRT